MLRNPARGPPIVKGPHSELSARLTDRLRRDHPDRLADIDHLTGGQVAAVAVDADTATRLTGKNRADLHPLNTRALHIVTELFGDLFTKAQQHLASHRIVDFLLRDAANDAIPEGL